MVLQPDAHTTDSIANRNKTQILISILKNFWWYILLLILLILGIILGIFLASTASSVRSSSKTVDQNLSEGLLALKYNKVSYATTHNSYSVFGTIAAGNQFGTIKMSLEKRCTCFDVRRTFLGRHKD